MSLIPGLIKDVEGIIFSYITEVPDIVRLITVSRSFNSQVPLYITHLTWTRALNQDDDHDDDDDSDGERLDVIVPAEFFYSMKNLVHTNIPALVDEYNDIEGFVDMKSLPNISIFVDLDFYTDEVTYTFPREFICSFLPVTTNRQMDIKIHATRKSSRNPIQCQTGWGGVEIRGTNVYIDYCIWSRTTYGDCVRAILFYRPITELSIEHSPSSDWLNHLPALQLTSLSTAQIYGIDDLRSIIDFIIRTPSLEQIGLYGDSAYYALQEFEGEPSWELPIDEDIPVIDRPFRFAMPMFVYNITPLLYYFPCLTALTVYIVYHEFHQYAGFIREMVTTRNIELTILYDSEKTNGLTVEEIQALYPDAVIRKIPKSIC